MTSLLRRAHRASETQRERDDKAREELAKSYCERKAAAYGTEAYEVFKQEIEHAVTACEAACHACDPNEEPTKLARAQGAIMALKGLLSTFELAVRKHQKDQKDQTAG